VIVAIMISIFHGVQVSKVGALMSKETCEFISKYLLFQTYDGLAAGVVNKHYPKISDRRTVVAQCQDCGSRHWADDECYSCHFLRSCSYSKDEPSDMTKMIMDELIHKRASWQKNRHPFEKEDRKDE